MRWRSKSHSIAQVVALWALIAGVPPSPLVTVMAAQECVSSDTTAMRYVLYRSLADAIPSSSSVTEASPVKALSLLLTASASTAFCGHPTTVSMLVRDGGIAIPRSLSTL